jgi:hypothetical protein
MIVCLAAVACTRPPPTNSVAIPPIASGEARIWFYRDDEPYAGRGTPAVSANGVYVGPAELGGAFYRDVPPGHYHVTVETVGQDVNQSAAADLTAGQQAYVKIVSLPDWVSGGDIMEYERPTFYAWLMPSQAALVEIGQLSFRGGS